MERKGDIEFGSSVDDDYKPLDLGANVVAAYEFSAGFS